MNQRRLWCDPAVVAARRATAEAFMGRALELPGHRYTKTEERLAAAHLRSVVTGQRAKERAT